MSTDSAPIPLDGTLGALVSGPPARARVLERLGLDYVPFPAFTTEEPGDG